MKNILTALLIIALGAGLAWQWSAVKKARDENAALRAQLEQSSALSAENERLSNLVARATSNQPIAKDQYQELLRLRGQVGQLRKQAAEVTQLKAENEQLRLATHASRPAAPLVTLLSLPRESWSFAGRATPEAALQSLIWSGSEGNVTNFLASFTPEMRTNLAKQWENKSDEEIATELKTDTVNKITALHVLDKKTVSADEAVLTIYAEGLGETNRMRMIRSGNEWQFAGEDKN